jgi:redox-sensitive bicupin YhaK (pirin superfamily)
MIKIIRSEERYGVDHGWLKTKHSFSFDTYYDPDNQHFGMLRVFNDDWIAPDQGFGMHPHRDMEIITYVIEGALKHKDSMGNEGVIRAGEVQRMSAGTGIFHSEFNASSEETVHLLQMWVFPDKRGYTPEYEQRPFTKEQQLNRLLPVVSGRENGEAMRIHQDATFYLSTLEAGKEVTHSQEPGRKMYVFIIKGEAVLNGEHTLKEGDTARITEMTDLLVKTESGAQFLLIDLL